MNDNICNNTAPLSKKGKSTVYTDKKREAMLYNAQHDEITKAKAKRFAESADKYLDKVEFIYDSIVAEGLFRYYFTGERPDPDHSTCRYCGADIGALVDIYGWKTDPFNAPWKVECPICGRKFPSNDFGNYYKLGLTRDGRFDPEKAKQEHIKLFGSLDNVGYLKNELYPEKDEHIDENGSLVNEGVHGWGVDDGTGYHTVNENGFKEAHTYIAFYLHNGVWGGTTKNNAVRTPLLAFRDAYLYTGDEKYAIAGAKILDRIADFYPDYDWYRWHEQRGGDPYHGKIFDGTWECGLCKEFALCYDAFYPVYENEELIKYLSEKAKAQGTDNVNPKNSADHLRKHIEDRILRVIYRAAVKSQLAGNFGMDQSSVTHAAVILNTMPETGEWIEWVMRPSPPECYGEKIVDRIGGNVSAQLIDRVDRDGMGDEASPGYNSIWLNSTFDIAEALSGYELYPSADLYKNPKFLKMFTSHIPLIMGDYYTVQVGDSGAYGSPGIVGYVNNMIGAYMATGDIKYAQLMYLLNDKSTKGLSYPDTVKDPSKLAKEVEEIIEKYGEYKPGSTLQAGYGLMALRDGENTAEKNTVRDFWIYMGITWGHGHSDSLNLGMDAYGLNMAPDLGYPKNTGTEANRIQWVSSTISHNTVVVNEKTQKALNDAGTPHHFDDAVRVKLMDADKNTAYDEVSEYRRAVIMVRANEDESYGVDLFRIKGGTDHMYSFHSQSESVCNTTGLDLIPQERGTYASPDVPYGVDPSPHSGKTWSQNCYVYPDGYTWLDNVTKDLSPEKDFSVDFEVTDYNKILKDSSGLHLRLTMLNDTPLDEVSIVDGHPVDNENNPKVPSKYLLARRKYSEEENSDTLFTTVFEPYKNTRYIKSIDKAKVVSESGNSTGASAVKITLTSGRTDYVICSFDNTVTYTIDGRFTFKGFAGVLSFENEKETYAYICDGEKIGDLITDKTSAYTGTIVNVTNIPSLKNTVEISPEGDIDINDIIGRHFYADNDKVQNGAYRIENAEKLENGNILIDLGSVSPIRKYKDKFKPEEGFVTNIDIGQHLRIPLSFTVSL